MKARLGVKAVRNGYGMTELSIVSGLSGRDDEDDSFEFPGSGILLPGFLSKVVDLETQETLDAGQMGEICYMGEQLMLGYWDNPEATRQTIDQDGWLHTGDIGYFDNKGRLHVVDRVKELIKYKGYQVSPSEIETVLLSHEAVKDAAVAAKPDERNGEVPVAFIVKQPNASLTTQDIQEYVKRKFITRLISLAEIHEDIIHLNSHYEEMFGAPFCSKSLVWPFQSQLNFGSKFFSTFNKHKKIFRSRLKDIRDS